MAGADSTELPDLGPRDAGGEVIAGTPSAPEDEEPLFETVLPLREADATERQRHLVERIVSRWADVAPGLRLRKWVLRGCAVGLAVALMLGLYLLNRALGGVGAITGFCVAIPVATIAFFVLQEWHLHRLARWAVVPWFCPRCGYDLQGLTSRGRLPCPECGADCDVEGRTRLTLDTDTILAEFRMGRPDVAWALRRHRWVRQLPPRECSALIGDVIKRTERSTRRAVAELALAALGVLLFIGGTALNMGWLLGGPGALAVCGWAMMIGSGVLLLRLLTRRRRRMAEELGRLVGQRRP